MSRAETTTFFSIRTYRNAISLAAMAWAIILSASISAPAYAQVQTAPSSGQSEGDVAYLEALHLFDHVDFESSDGLVLFKNQLGVAAGKGNKEAQALMAVINAASTTSDLNVKLRPLADAGNVVAQTFVGSAFRTEAPVDFNLARKYLQAAANQPAGSAQAQLELGAMYAGGMGVPVNEMVAKRWIKRAAANGSPKAKRTMAEIDNEAANARATDEARERKVRNECDKMAPSARFGCEILMRR